MPFRLAIVIDKDARIKELEDALRRIAHVLGVNVGTPIKGVMPLDASEWRTVGNRLYEESRAALQGKPQR